MDGRPCVRVRLSPSHLRLESLTGVCLAIGIATSRLLARASSNRPRILEVDDIVVIGKDVEIRVLNRLRRDKHAEFDSLTGCDSRLSEKDIEFVRIEWIATDSRHADLEVAVVIDRRPLE